MFDDETLTLYFYGDELDAVTTAQIDTQLQRDPALAARYAALSDQLTGWRSSLKTSDASPQLEALLHNALLQATADQSNAPTSRWLPWSVAATIVLAAVLLIQPWRIPSAPVLVNTSASIPNLRSAPTIRLVQSHLAQSQLQLVRIERVDRSERSALIDELIDQNQAIEMSARRAGDGDLARFLRAFEPVLERLAGASSNAADSQQLLDQLNFELSAMLTKLDATASDSALSL